MFSNNFKSLYIFLRAKLSEKGERPLHLHFLDREEGTRKIKAPQESQRPVSGAWSFCSRNINDRINTLVEF